LFLSFGPAAGNCCGGSCKKAAEEPAEQEQNYQEACKELHDKED